MASVCADASLQLQKEGTGEMFEAARKLGLSTPVWFEGQKEMQLLRLVFEPHVCGVGHTYSTVIFTDG